MGQLFVALCLGFVAGVGLGGCGLSSNTRNADAATGDSGASDASTTPDGSRDAGRDARTQTDARVPIDSGTDSALPTLCEALETAVVDQIDALSQCSGDDECETVYSPLCGAQSTRFDTGCFLYRNVNVSLDALNATASRCQTQLCFDGCQPADCDCAPPPPAACIDGRCASAEFEADLSVCDGGDACIVVPYRHCCGATKRAIRASMLDAYNSHPEWQVFDVPSVCALIGPCLDDSAVTEATCGGGQCSLVFP